jgi:hypothetical protein
MVTCDDGANNGAMVAYNMTLVQLVHNLEEFDE